MIFDDDKGFYQAINTITRTAKRPIILTANNPQVTLPTDSKFLILDFSPPKVEVCNVWQSMNEVTFRRGGGASLCCVPDLLLSRVLSLSCFTLIIPFSESAGEHVMFAVIMERLHPTIPTAAIRAVFQFGSSSNCCKP